MSKLGVRGSFKVLYWVVCSIFINDSIFSTKKSTDDNKAFKAQKKNLKTPQIDFDKI